MPSRCPRCGGALLEDREDYLGRRPAERVWDCLACGERVGSPPLAIECCSVGHLLDGANAVPTSLGLECRQCARNAAARRGVRARKVEEA